MMTRSHSLQLPQQCDRTPQPNRDRTPKASYNLHSQTKCDRITSQIQNAMVVRVASRREDHSCGVSPSQTNPHNFVHLRDRLNFGHRFTLRLIVVILHTILPESRSH
jgi:hypothetical protein